MLSRKDDEAMVGGIEDYARLCAVQSSAFDVGGELYTAVGAQGRMVYFEERDPCIVLPVDPAACLLQRRPQCLEAARLLYAECGYCQMQYNVLTMRLQRPATGPGSTGGRRLGVDKWKMAGRTPSCRLTTRLVSRKQTESKQPRATKFRA